MFGFCNFGNIGLDTTEQELKYALSIYPDSITTEDKSSFWTGISSETVLSLINKTIDVLDDEEESFLRIEAPAIVVGEVQGDLNDFLGIFKRFGPPGQYQFVFLGNYLSSVPSIECLCLLMMYKIQYKNDVHLLRGELEFKNNLHRNNFKDHCEHRFGEDAPKILQAISTLFSWLPICASISRRIFCCHGGLSPTYTQPQKLNKLPLPFPEDLKDFKDDVFEDVDAFIKSKPFDLYNVEKQNIYNFCEEIIDKETVLFYGSNEIEEFLSQNKWTELCISGTVHHQSTYFCGNKLLVLCGKLMRVDYDLAKHFYEIYDLNQDETE